MVVQELNDHDMANRSMVVEHLTEFCPMMSLSLWHMKHTSTYLAVNKQDFH
jgi:hypothetical protein